MTGNKYFNIFMKINEIEVTVLYFLEPRCFHIVCLEYCFTIFVISVLGGGKKKRKKTPAEGLD